MFQIWTRTFMGRPWTNESPRNVRRAISRLYPFSLPTNGSSAAAGSCSCANAAANTSAQAHKAVRVRAIATVASAGCHWRADKAKKASTLQSV